MKYVVDLSSPDFHILIDAARREIIASAATRAEMGRRWGKGHALTVSAGQREVAASRCLKALIEADEAARPERATPGRAEVVATYFEEDLPRPVPPRPKASNIRRRYSKGAC